MNDQSAMINAEEFARRSPHFAELYGLILDFCSMALDFNITVKPFSTDALIRLRQLGDQEILQIYSSLHSYSLVCQEAKKKKINLKDSSAFAKTALEYMNLETSSEFFDKIRAEDIVEIYDSSGRQIFRNFRLYELTQYSLSDLITFEWVDLYQRPKAVNEQMFKRFFEIVNSNEIVNLSDVPTHVMKEIRLSPPQIFEVSLKYGNPTFDRNTKVRAGIIMSSHGQYLGHVLNETQIDFI